MRKCNKEKESVFLAGSLKGIGYKGSVIDILLLVVDNQADIKLAINPVNHFRAKHIDIQYNKVLELDYIMTEEIVADGLTKPLSLKKYEYFITMLGLGNKKQK